MGRTNFRWHLSHTSGFLKKKKKKSSMKKDDRKNSLGMKSDRVRGIVSKAVIFLHFYVKQRLSAFKQNDGINHPFPI